MLRLVRPRKWACWSSVARTISYEWKPRSHNSSMPGPTERSSRSAVGTSPERIGTDHRVADDVGAGLDQREHADLGERAGPAPGRRASEGPVVLRACRPRRASCRRSPSAAAHPGTPPASAPWQSAGPPPGTAPGAGAPRPADGPGRWRRCSADATPPASLAAPSRQPATTSASTCRIDSDAHSPIATTRVTTRWVGRRRRRRSRVPVASIAASTDLVGDRRLQRLQQRPVPQPGRPERRFPRPSPQRHRQPSRST